MTAGLEGESCGRTCLGDVRFNFDTVDREERLLIDAAHQARFERGATQAGGVPAGQRFSLAFSGGGIRAAAFQAGVLWRLAKENRLKDVDHLAAVSGGAYVTSAFASHCLAAEREATEAVARGEEPEDLDSFYRRVVAKMVCRMQSNAGNFVRDSCSHPGYKEEGAGLLPRFCDYPILCFVLGITMAVNPIMFVVAIWVPATASFQLFFGAGLRAAFCDPDRQDVFGFSTLWNWSRWPFVCWLFLGCVVLCTIVTLFMKVMPCLKIKSTPEGLRAPHGYLVAHSFNAFLVRFTAGVLVLILFLALVLVMQDVAYSNKAARLSHCRNYVQQYAHDSACSNIFDGKIWYLAPEFKNLTSVILLADKKRASYSSFPMICMIFCFVLLALVLCSCCTVGLVGTKFMTFVGKWVGPVALLFATEQFVEFGIFAPITENKRGILAYDKDRWNTFISVSLLLALVLLPFYEELRGWFHTYYKRCLQKNYFAGGKDILISELRESTYCPFVILTVTANDYQPPGDTDSICELSLSPLHCGGNETRYINVEDTLSLAKCTALSGAGCLDAISLSMSNNLSLRFWLEVLNLTWGDFIIFRAHKTPVMDYALKWFCKDKWKGLGYRFLCRIQGALFWMVLLGLMNFGWMVIRQGNLDADSAFSSCSQGASIFFWADIMVLVLIVITFFSFIPGLELLGLSLLTRQLLQATKYCYVGERPPVMLYLTDGGVLDCTALVQLMRRECEHILLVLAAADASDDLGVLRTAMRFAEAERVGSFFDPVDHRRSVDCLFERFKADKTKEEIHLGICYNWDRDGKLRDEARIGHLYIVKNRLPPRFERSPVQQLLTEEDVTCTREMEHAMGQQQEHGWENLSTDQLGPFGCCDCCHTWCNCGPKFPHGTFTGYLYLTPQWCNGLMRLGYSLSKTALDTMTATSSNF